MIHPIHYWNSISWHHKCGLASLFIFVVRDNEWNDLGNTVCVTGMRKSAYGASINQMSPKKRRSIWTEHIAFFKLPGTGNRTMIAQSFSTGKADSFPSSLSSYRFRAVNNHAMFLPWYADASHDDSANAFGSRVRDLLRSTDGLASNSPYVSLLTPLSSLLMALLLSSLTMRSGTSISPTEMSP